MDRLTAEIRDRLRQTAGDPCRRDELVDLGLRGADLRRLLRKGRLQQHHSRYVDGDLQADLARMACAQAAYPGAALSHFAAAKLAELRCWVDRGRPDAPPIGATWLTRRPGMGRNDTRPDLVLRLAGLEPPDLTRHIGLIVTTEARTVVDLARELPLREAVVTVDHALRVSTTRTALDEAISRQQFWPGIRRARSAVAFGDPRSESALESLARAAFADAGLPPPILQAQFWNGAIWLPDRVDFWWPEFRTVGEADGLAKYEAATPAERRRLHRQSFQREQRLADQNVELIRFGWEDVLFDPAGLHERMRRAFTRGLRRTGDRPVWRAADPHDPYLWPHFPPPDDQYP